MKNSISKLFTILFVFATTALLAQEETTITTTKISVEIKASSTNKELKEMATLFKKKKIDLKFKKIERNHKGEIIGISSSYKGPNGFKGNYNFSGPVPIKPFNFSVQFDGNDAISSIDYEKSKKGDIIALHSKKDVQKNIFHIRANQGYDGSEFSKPLIVVNNKISEDPNALNNIKPKNIESVIILKNTSATSKYGDKAKNGVVEITLKKKAALKLNNEEKENDNEDENDKINPLYVLDGKEVSNLDAIDIDPNNIKSVSVLKNSSATTKYGEKGMNGVVEITSKKNLVIKLDEREDVLSDAKPLIIIDGEEMASDYDYENLKPDAIESVSVLKGKSAKETYGEKGKNGVIVIKLKKK